MRLDGPESDNVEDRRGQRVTGRGVAVGGAGGVGCRRGGTFGTSTVRRVPR